MTPDLDLAEKAIVAQIVTNHQTNVGTDSIKGVRYIKGLDIDRKTEEIMKEGTTINGKRFVPSAELQTLQILNTLVSSSASISYPVTFDAVDSTAYVFANKAELEAFSGAVASWLAGVVQGGTDLKNQVQALTTTTEVKNFQDPR
jgi:hypothetical protein